VIAAAGAAVMVSEDIGEGTDALRGDLFAVLGAVFAAAYILTGRSLRTSGSEWLPYVTAVYSTAAVVLVLTALAAGHSAGGYSAETYLFFVLLALIPQLIGHTAINRSLGYLPAASVAIAILGEPVGATLLGAVFLDEIPTAVQLAGAALVLAGVYAGLRGTITAAEPAVAPD
jgi:drug/metabolite transporter (DMT)-like permease